MFVAFSLFAERTRMDLSNGRFLSPHNSSMVKLPVAGLDILRKPTINNLVFSAIPLRSQEVPFSSEAIIAGLRITHRKGEKFNLLESTDSF